MLSAVSQDDSLCPADSSAGYALLRVLSCTHGASTLRTLTTDRTTPRRSRPALPSQCLAPPHLPLLSREGASATHMEVLLSMKEEAMQCARCAGMNVPEIIVEGGARIFAMRCVHCGDIIDHVILMNRRHRPSVRPGRPRSLIHEDPRSTWKRPAPINMRRADEE